MLEDGKISNKQIIFLIITIITSTTILLFPSLVYKEAKQDSWMTLFFLMVFGIIVVYIITTLGLMFKDKTIIQYSEIIVGKVLGKILGIIYFVFFIHINAFIIREFSELLLSSFYPETPMLFFAIGIIIASTYAVRSGIEVIGRVSEVLFPIFIIVISGIVILAFKDMNFNNLIPILANGWAPVLKGTYYEFLLIGETIVLAMLIPYLNIPQKVRKSGIISIVSTCLLGILILGGIIAVFGEQTGYLRYPFLAVARYVSVAGIVERMDPLIMIIWIGGVFVKISVFHYCAVLALAQWLNIKDYRPLVLPVGGIMVVLSVILWENIAILSEQLTGIVIIPYLTIQVGIPVLLLIIAKLRKKER
ncbi:MAG: endospore germination permease [Eubacteriales bacterium]